MGRRKKRNRPRGRPDYLGFTVPLLLADIYPKGASVKDIHHIIKNGLFTRQAIYAALKRLEKERIVEGHLTKRPTVFKCVDVRKARNFAFSKYNEIYPPQANNKHNVFRLRFKELQRQHDALPSAYQGTTGLVERINIAGMKVIGTPNMLDLDDVNKALKKIKEIKHIAHETEYLERWRAKTEKRG